MITKDFFNFMAKLDAHNSKEWLDQHRNEYEVHVKKPFEDFVQELGVELNKFDSEITGDFKKSIFRINRDIRFAKDKKPYKNNRSAAFSMHGRKDHDDPGYYVELGINKCYIAGGAWAPSPEKLQKIRAEIYYNADEFHKLLKEKKFMSTYGTIQGERSKKMPKEIADWVKDSEFIYHKQYYFYREFELEECFEKDVAKNIASMFRAGYPVNQFLRRAMRDVE
jgi:uncharacterized protein (TIGR02453 family)